MVFAPLEGWRHVKVTDRHTAFDYATCSRDSSETHFPDTAKIVLVQDNLNIHKPASLYEKMPFPRPRPAGSSSGSNGITDPIKDDLTPPSTAVGSTWPNLNSAFSRRNVWIAASVISKSSPAKSARGRIDRYKHHAKADWQFTTANACVKLKRLYLGSDD